MNFPKIRRFSAVFFGALLLAITIFMWVKTDSREKISRELAAMDSTAGPEAVPETLPRMEKRSRMQKRDGVPVVDSDESWDFTTVGQPLSIRLALDEVVLRQVDGKDRILALNPPATMETLPARMAAIREEGVVFPVAYLVGEERSDGSRRIVTPDLSVQMSGASAEKVAAAHDLIVKSHPEYAPGWVIMSADSPLAALDAMVNLRTVSEVAAADVLLASQRQLRALPNDPLVTNQWHLKKTSASSAGTDVNIETIWNYPSTTGSRGAGIRVGVVDDGLQTAHPDLSANVDATNDKDWNGNDADPNPGTGDDHGTACAGNVAAKGNNGIGVSGTAPDATLVGMRLIAAATTDAQEAEAMYYLPQLIQIKSNSWGPNDTGSTVEAPGALTIAALKNAAELGRGGKGNILLWAGGNGGDVSDNSNYDGYANSIHTIAIGATDSSGNRAYYSEPGANLVVCAPSSGVLGITTVDRTGTNGYESGDYTSTFGGTSSATPTAAGIVALMLEKNPNLGWRDVQEILIRSAAKIKPADADWVTNPAGFSFNHNFGAGLINATAAVNLSQSWSNLASQTNVVSTQSGQSIAIPNNNTTGITRSFNLASSNLRVEQVTVKVNINHTARGNLAITLTSPGGMSSRLAEVRADTNDNYANWTFSSVRNWGESSAGTWTLKIADLSNTSNSTGGTLTSAELTVFGSAAAPVNPSPLVQITQPSTNQVFSPGANVVVNVNASDLAIGGAAGTITSVQLYDNEVLVGTKSVPPYSFNLSPALGQHSLVATATDSEGAVGTSVSVGFNVVNQTPTITAVSLSATGQSYADVPLTVASVSASDPENQTLQYAYQWQASSNQVVYANVPGATSSTAPAMAGSLLRCVVTASDGNSSSEPFTTAAVNLLGRPATSVTVGENYQYASGLVLRGTDSQLTRPAIINEFSQGPAGGSAEWIEILTLQDGSLAYWDISDGGGNMLIFADSPVWDNIPAGTLIVIYNGASKDPLLPADDLDATDGRMVVGSTNGTYFDLVQSDGWPPLGNSGDSIFLNDENQEEVHSVAYGNSVATTPNVGSVGSGKSAFFSGDTDTGADIVTNWIVTTSLSARFPKVVKAAGDLFISEYVEGSGNNKAIEIYNPSSVAVNLTASFYKLEFYNNGAASPTVTINLTGSINASSTFVVKNNSPTGAIAAVVAQVSSSNVIHTGDDAIVLRKGTEVVDCFGQVGLDPGSAWTVGGVTTADKTLRRKSSVTQGDVIFSDAFNPSLEWDMFDADTLTGLGSHSVNPTNPALTLSISPTTFAENAGASAATGTVSIPAVLGAPLVVSLASSDSSEATVPASVTIAAGQTTSPAFAVAAVDDDLSDGTQALVVTATASGYTDATSNLQVTDNEPMLTGVTPGNGNSPANLAFIATLRSGGLNLPSLFRFGSGATVPAGLTLDPATGVLSGTIASGNPAGVYEIVVERYNSLGEVVSQSFSLTLSAASGNTYLAWIATQNIGSMSGLLDDADGDGLANGIENHLGTAAGIPNTGLTQISANASPQSLVFRHSRSNAPASDLAVAYEWSANLTQWHASAATSGGTTVTITTETITDVAAPANDLVEVTATVAGAPGTRIFVRIKATLAAP